MVRLRNWIGDVILSVPTLQRLETAGFDLHLIGKGWAGDLLEGFGWKTHRLPAGRWEHVKQLRRLRREIGPDAVALAFPYSFSSALEMRLGGLPAFGHRTQFRGPLLSRAVELPRGLHTMDGYWALGQAFLGVQPENPPACVTWKLSPRHEAEADALLRSHGVPEGFILACPFASGTIRGENKHWPDFPRFVREFSRESGRRILLCPGPGEETAVAGRDYPDALILPGVGMGAYAGLLARASLTVSNDTGPGHLAAAVGATLVSVLGPTEPAEWGVRGPRAHIMRIRPGWVGAPAVLEKSLSLLGLRHPSSS